MVVRLIILCCIMIVLRLELRGNRDIVSPVMGGDGRKEKGEVS